nr:SdpI family protein [uncultured Methanoregula sp.]
MMKFTSSVWNAMGWCPMTAAAGHPLQGTPGNLRREDPSGDGGPVARRSARFMRMTWGIIILSWVIPFLVLPHLPAEVPIHWNLYGQADGFSSRFIGAFGLPVILSVTTVLLMALPRFDSVQTTLAAFRENYAILILATVSLIFCIEIVTLMVALGLDLPVITIIPILMGLLFIALGSIMPNIGRNTLMGIRFPWTLESDEIWKKTHEHGGPAFMAAGILTVLGSLVAGIWAIALMLVIILGVTVYISVWSYRYAKRVGGTI